MVRILKAEAKSVDLRIGLTVKWMRESEFFIITGIRTAAGREKAVLTIAIEAVLEADFIRTVDRELTRTKPRAYQIPWYP